MTAVAVYLAVVVAFAAVCCGHHGEEWPLRRWRAPDPPRRHVPHWARTQPLELSDPRAQSPNRS